MATSARVLLAALTLAGLLFVSNLSAAEYPDQGSAYAACQADLAAHIAVNPDPPSQACSLGTSPTIGQYWCQGYARGQVRACNDGPRYYIFPMSSACSTRAPMLNVYYRGDGASCAGGCEFAPDIGAGVTNRIIKLGSGGAAVTRVARMAPTGSTCTVGDGVVSVQPQTTEQCQQQGTLTQCLTADGRTCAVASSGKKFCWETTEAGVKVSGNEAASKIPSGMEVKAPPKQPTNGGDWQQGGSGTVSVTNGGVTNNYNTTNYSSTYGSQGGGANGGGADGEGNGGAGEGEGEGNGSASGGGTCSTPYVCSGDPIMCSLGQQMWLSRCGDRKGDANGDGVPDVLVGDAPQNPDPGEDVNPTRWGINVGTDMLDTENIFGAGSCPMMPSFSIMGQTISPSEFPQWCTLVAVMRAVVLLMGAFIAISLLMGGS